MDTGIIASRYAGALFRYAAEQGATDTVFDEAARLQVPSPPCPASGM